ncbi:hypothetical protein N8534_00630, partial [bacterium]|nr:hypothetical protein [bacterium]
PVGWRRFDPSIERFADLGLINRNRSKKCLRYRGRRSCERQDETSPQGSKCLREGILKDSEVWRI